MTGAPGGGDLPPDLVEDARALLERACDLGVSLATAESCTGGLIASILTDVEGYSHAFDRGFVVYTDDAKSDMLGVPPDLVRRYGAVSREAAVAMSEGGLARSAAGACLAVTGFAGPGASGDESGLVHLAVARRGGGTAHREAHFGDIGRGPVRIAAARAAVAMLMEALSEPI